MALASGVLSFVCLFGFGGLLAIALGWLAHGEIERSEGRIDGKGLANAGIGLGIANVVLSVVGLGILIALAVRPEPFVASRGGSPPPHLVPAPTAPTLPSPAPGPPQRDAEDDSGEAEAELPPPLPVLPAQIGKIAIIEASTQSALEHQLLAQLKESARSGERVLLWTVTSPCEPCAAVGRALPDARMQRALSGVRLVRADAHAFSVDLQRLGVPTEFVPGFTLLDGGARPVDHIYGGEWDDDIPANIAPILDKFMRRTLSARRHQWSRPLREGETPL